MSGASDEAAVETGPQLYLRRINNLFVKSPFTVGKLYKLHKRIDENGVSYFFAEADNRKMLNVGDCPTTYWQRVWVYPNGTELEEI